MTNTLLYINGMPYKLTCVPSLPDDDGGIFDALQNEIKVSMKYPHNSIISTFYHELGHVFLEQTGLHNLLKKKQEEAFCDAFGYWMARFISDNYYVLPKMDVITSPTNGEKSGAV